MTFLEFAQCKRGHYTPIRPMAASVPGNERWRIIEDEPEFFVCNECKRINELEVDGLKVFPTQFGLEPYNTGAPIRRFDISLPCDEELNCTPMRVIAILRADTTVDELEREKSSWRGRALSCPSGHAQDFPSGWE